MDMRGEKHCAVAAVRQIHFHAPHGRLCEFMQYFFGVSGVGEQLPLTTNRWRVVSVQFCEVLAFLGRPTTVGALL